MMFLNLLKNVIDGVNMSRAEIPSIEVYQREADEIFGIVMLCFTRPPAFLLFVSSAYRKTLDYP